MNKLRRRIITICVLILYASSVMTTYASVIEDNLDNLLAHTTVSLEDKEGELSTSAIVKMTSDMVVFSVTIPAILPVHVDEEGEIFVSEEVYIINNSSKPITINQIEISPTEGWLMDNYQDLKDKKLKANTRILGLKIDEAESIAGDKTIYEYEDDKSVVIPKKEKDGENQTSNMYQIEYDVNLSARIKEISQSDSLTIMDTVFIIDWAKDSKGGS